MILIVIGFVMEAGHELPKSWTFLNNLELVFQDFLPGLSTCKLLLLLYIFYIYIYIYYIYVILNSWRGGTLRERGEDFSSERGHHCSSFQDFPRSVHNTGSHRHRTTMIVSTYERLRVGDHTWLPSVSIFSPSSPAAAFASSVLL